MEAIVVAIFLKDHDEVFVSNFYHGERPPDDVILAPLCRNPLRVCRKIAAHHKRYER